MRKPRRTKLGQGVEVTAHYTIDSIIVHVKKSKQNHIKSSPFKKGVFVKLAFVHIKYYTRKCKFEIKLVIISTVDGKKLWFMLNDFFSFKLI